MAQSTSDLAKKIHVTKLLRCVSRGTIRDLKSVMRGRADLDIVDDNGSPLLHHAVLNPNTSVLEYLLSVGLSVETKDKQGRTPVHVWAREGALKNIKVLIAHGANIHARDDEQSTALHYTAVQSNPDEIISYLVGQGLNIEEKNEAGKTALHCSIQAGNVKAMMSLVSKGANISQPMIGGANALHLAVLHSRPWTVEYLLSHGMDINARDDEGMTPLHVCARKGLARILVVLLTKGASIDARSNDGSTPLLCCAAGGSLESLRVLVEKGANVRAQDNEGKTAIHVAVKNANTRSIVEFLLKQGLSVEARDNLKRTPLHYYAQHGNLPSIKTLLDKGANIEARATMNTTALHFAAANRKTTKIIEFLLSKGMLVEEPDEIGLTPLHHSIHFANVRNMKFLVNKGADVNATGQDDVTSLHIAAVHGDTTETLEYLLDKGVPIDEKEIHGRTPLLVCAIKGNLQKMKLLVEKGADILMRDDQGVSALHFATINKKTTDLMQYLLDLGIPLEVEDNFGLTPLLHCALRGNLKNLAFLCDKGANLNSLDHNKATALHHAARNVDGGPIITYLLAKGISVDVRDEFGASPFMISQMFGMAENERILLENGATREPPSIEVVTILMSYQQIF